MNSRCTIANDFSCLYGFAFIISVEEIKFGYKCFRVLTVVVSSWKWTSLEKLPVLSKKRETGVMVPGKITRKQSEILIKKELGQKDITNN